MPLGAASAKKRWEQRAGEVRMISDVVKICSELKFEAFPNWGHFANGEIQVSVIWAEQRIAAFASEMTSSRNTISDRACDPRSELSVHGTEKDAKFRNSAGLL